MGHGRQLFDGDDRGGGTGAGTGKNVVENNSLAGCSPVTCKQGLDVIGGGGSSSLGGGMIGGGAGLAAVIGEILGGDSEDAESKPNAGKDLTDAEKAEYGGAGSGTPGGWEPQDEENARNNEAHNAANGRNLNAELTGEEIANGHAYEKHVIQQSEFNDLGIKTKEQFARHIENVVKNPTSTKELSGGRSAYWDQSTGTVVIRNPKPGDGGTAFRPVNGRAYFDNLR